MQDDTPQSFRVFISHAGHDTPIAILISLLLKSIGVTCFLDVISMEGGDRIKGRILEEIKGSDEVLLLVTPHSLRSPFVTFEYGMAMALGKRTVLIYHDLSVNDIIGEQGLGSLISDEYLLSILQIERYLEGLKGRVQP